MAREQRGIIRLHAITPLPTHGVHGEKDFKAPGLEPFGDIPLTVGVRNQEEPLRSSGCRVTGFISRSAGNAIGSSTHFHRTPHSYPSIEYQQNAPALTGWHRHDWVESRMGASTGATAPPRFPSPLIKPDVPISGIRLPDGLHGSLTNPAPAALEVAPPQPG